MTTSVLGSVTLGYELLWNQKRRCCGVRLFVDPHGYAAVDARHLIKTLAELWPDTASAPTLLLQVRDTVLLRDLLTHTPAHGPWLEVPDDQLASDVALVTAARAAKARGVPLVWSGDAGDTPAPAVHSLFHKTLRALTPHEALTALRQTLQPQQQQQPPRPGLQGTALAASTIYEGVASQALLDHTLDRQGAWAVAGWPTDEIVHAYRHKQIQPSRTLLRAMTKAIEDDASLDELEHRMGEEPLLTYRFLRYANSAHLGARSEVTNVRQGLMVMGYSKLRAWLLEQMPQASTDPNLEPIRLAMVLRARIMEWLADAGVEDALRHEVHLCGVLSQLDVLLGEPLGTAIHRLPLPGRIASAVVGQSGPYAAWLAVAAALESSNTRMVREVCRGHRMAVDGVNRALLRALATV